MFTNQTREGSQSTTAETFIGPSVKLEGNFTGDGDVVIEGTLTGNLVTKGDVRVGPNALIEAEVRAKNAIIAGKVRGNIQTQSLLRLAATASISGDIKTGALQVEEGAAINGKIVMGKERASASVSNEEPPRLEQKPLEHKVR